MIDWLSWPLAQHVNTWIIALLKGLAAVQKFTILIDVTLLKIELVCSHSFGASYSALTFIFTILTQITRDSVRKILWSCLRLFSKHKKAYFYSAGVQPSLVSNSSSGGASCSFTYASEFSALSRGLPFGKSSPFILHLLFWSSYNIPGLCFFYHKPKCLGMDQDLA